MFKQHKFNTERGTVAGQTMVMCRHSAAAVWTDPMRSFASFDCLFLSNRQSGANFADGVCFTFFVMAAAGKFQVPRGGG
jgi:hypothetical protein